MWCLLRVPLRRGWWRCCKILKNGHEDVVASWVLGKLQGSVNECERETSDMAMRVLISEQRALLDSQRHLQTVLQFWSDESRGSWRSLNPIHTLQITNLIKAILSSTQQRAVKMASCNVAQSFSPFRASATAKRGRVVAVSAAQNRSVDRRCSSGIFCGGFIF